MEAELNFAIDSAEFGISRSIRSAILDAVRTGPLAIRIGIAAVRKPHRIGQNIVIDCPGPTNLISPCDLPRIGHRDRRQIGLRDWRRVGSRDWR